MNMATADSRVYLIRGLYHDRVVILFRIGNSIQSINVGYSELNLFFEEQQIRFITAGDKFEIYELDPKFMVGKCITSIPEV